MKPHALQKWAVACISGLLASSAAADVPYFNGFETPASVNDFLSPSGTPGGGITRVLSGGGTLGYTPAAGSYYAEIQNTENYGGPNMGYAGITNFGTAGAPAPSGYGESVDVYIDTARWLPTGIPGSDFVISTVSGVVKDTDFEHLNFIFTVNSAGTIDISSANPQGGTGPITFVDLATINKSGWYRLQATFLPVTMNVENDVSVLDLQGNTLGTTHFVSSTLSADLIGPGSMTFGPWQSGFAGDVLAIDDLQTFAVPEPTVLGLAPVATMLLRRRRSHC